MFLFCLVFAMFCARLFICASWSPAGKGLTSWLSFVVSSVSLSLSHWYPGSGVVLDCIDSWSLQPYLLCVGWTMIKLPGNVASVPIAVHSWACLGWPMIKLPGNVASVSVAVHSWACVGWPMIKLPGYVASVFVAVHSWFVWADQRLSFQEMLLLSL